VAPFIEPVDQRVEHATMALPAIDGAPLSGGLLLSALAGCGADATRDRQYQDWPDFSGQGD